MNAENSDLKWLLSLVFKSMSRHSVTLSNTNSPIIYKFLVLGFENLVFAIFEFVHALVESPKFRVAVKSGLSDLMYYIVLYMQITHEQVCLISKKSNFYLVYAPWIQPTVRKLLIRIFSPFFDQFIYVFCFIEKFAKEQDSCFQNWLLNWMMISLLIGSHICFGFFFDKIDAFFFNQTQFLFLELIFHITLCRSGD